MAENPDPPWLLPAEIPFADLKARDLEEYVYRLLRANDFPKSGTGSEHRPHGLVGRDQT
jgi:hypothetical protein